MSAAITARDARYEELFQVENEAHGLGMHLIEDPYPAFRRMLATGAVLKGNLAECMGHPADWAGLFTMRDRPTYTAVSFDAVNEAFMDNETYSSEIYMALGVHVRLGDTILNMVGEKHRRYRILIQKEFQPSVAGSWWNDKFIRDAVDELVAAIETKGRADLNAELFARLPMHVVTAGFGLSGEAGLTFRYNMRRAGSPSLSDADKAVCVNAAMAVLRAAIAERRQKPRDDIISKLAQAKLEEADGSKRALSEQEIVDYCRLIVFAGGGTTWRQLGITIFALLENPSQLEAVRLDRSLIPNAVLESARWHPTDPLFPRGVTKDTTLQGVSLPRGALLHLCLGSANRDPTRWQNPDAFDVHRPIQRSLAFGAGRHSCLGRHVAQQEITVALNAIFDRLPNLRWDPSAPPPKLTGGLMGRGPGPLKVAFG